MLIHLPTCLTVAHRYDRYDCRWRVNNTLSQQSSTKLYNYVENTFTLKVELNTSCLTLKAVDQWFFDCLRTSWEGRGEGCRIDTVPTTLNCTAAKVAYVLSSSNRQLSDHSPLVLTSRYYTTTCRRLLPVADSTVCRRHVATHRSVRYLANAWPPSTTTNLCRDASDVACLRCIFLVANLFIFCLFCYYNYFTYKTCICYNYL